VASIVDLSGNVSPFVDKMLFREIDRNMTEICDAQAVSLSHSMIVIAKPPSELLLSCPSF
jgi:hypothetical protein